MYRWTVSFVAVLFLSVFILGCSSESGSPVTPSANSDMTGSIGHAGQTQTHLWGYYDVFIDIENQTAEAVPNRQVMFVVNVVNFLNNAPGSMGFKINDILDGADYTDVDIDVSLTHPFPGMPQYHGYDVRGVFMGDGSASMMYNGDVVYPVFGTDQFMFPDPDGGNGAPDGYTRWFNLSEFGSASMPLFGYTQGNMAAPGFAGTATLCPYKYFADGLGTNDDLWTWLNDHADQYGIFSSGATNARNYYLRFPNDKGVTYGYAVIANWEAEDVHPSNAPEAVTCSVIDNSDVYYVDAGNNGGNLILDINMFGWEYQPSTINIESTVLGAVSSFDTSTIVTGGGDHYSTYHVDIPADNVQGVDGNEYWVIAQYDAYDYTNKFGVMNDAWDDYLAAFFRYDLDVAGEPDELPPICDIQMVTDITFPYVGLPVEIEFDASGSTDPDGDDGLLIFEWDFDGDEVFGDPYDSGTDANPTKLFDQDYTGDILVKVTDESGLDSICTLTGFDLTILLIKNIDITNETAPATDLGMDPNNGDILVYYPSVGHVRRYTRSSNFQSYDAYTSVLSHANAQWIDVNFAGYFELSFYENYYMRMHFYNPNGYQVHLWNHFWSGTLAGITDITGFPNAGSHPGALGSYMWKTYTSYGNVIGNVRYDPGGSGTTFNTGFFPSNGSGLGYNQINGANVKGGEVDISGNTYWWVERIGSVAKHFTIAGNWPYLTSFGEWQVPGDDDDHINEPKDITRDNENTYYILDELSDGTYIIKGFNYSGSVTTAITSFGSTDDWTYTPIRIEGSDYDGILAVLQNDGTDSYISIFTEDEIPDW